MGILDRFFNKRTGRLGEELACKYLRKKGYRILARNYDLGFCELDIVAEKDGAAVFVEVKTRTTEQGPYAEEAVDARKMRKIEGGAEVFLARNGISDAEWRIDIIAVEETGKGLEVTRHIEGA
ncbi:MAG: YraN family protein [Planctomycetota bacterium]|nr:YraN family protein [Planctomycetota bacterium]